MGSKRWITGVLAGAVGLSVGLSAVSGVQAAGLEGPTASALPSPSVAATQVTVKALRVETAPTPPSAAPAERRVARYVQPGEPPANLRRLRAAEVPVSLRVNLQGFLRAHRDAKIGALVPVEHDGKAYVARVETHYHPEGGPVRPWGPHRGVSLFVEID